jgi:hypothetical protein
MGAFDDLPTANPDPNKKAPGAFDDIPAAKGQPGVKDHFADIKGRDPVTLKPLDSTPKIYWDATKAAFVDIAGDIDKGFGDKPLSEIWKTESLPAHLVQGAMRGPAMRMEIDPATGSLTEREARPEELTDKELHGEFSSLLKDMRAEDKTEPSVLQSLRELGVTIKDKPGLAIGSLAKTVVADPELLLPWLWEAIPEATAAKVAQAAKAMGASVDIAKAAEVGGRVVGRMALGGATSAAVEGAQQFATGDYDASKVGTAAIEGAVMSAPGRFARKEHATPAVERPVVADSKSPQMELDLTPTEAATVAAIPEERLTPLDMTRESLAQATSADPITPEMIADVAKEPIKSPTEPAERLVRAVKQAAVGGTVGAAVGYGVAKETNVDKITGLETGFAIGAALPLLKARKYTGPDISALVNARNGQVGVVARHAYQFQHQIEKLIPLKADRELLADMIDRGVEPEAGTPMHEAHRVLKKFFADLGQQAVDAGVIDALRENYISHIVEEAPQPGILAKIFGQSTGGGGSGPSGKAFAKPRAYGTFEELNDALKDSGLKLKTKDASEIAGIYANAVYKSIADKQLLDALKETTLPDGTKIVMAANPAKGEPRVPSSYVRAAAPQLQGVAIHPDVAPDLGFVYSHRNPNWVVRKAEQITSSVKRSAVSLSMFHAKTLLEGMAIAGNGVDRIRMVNAAKQALAMYREGGNNDVIDHLIKGGLIVGRPEDVAGRSVQSALGAFAENLNARLPLKGFGLGAALQALAAVDKNLEHMTFGFLQTGLKLNVAMSEFERMVGNGATRERAARVAAGYTNDIFGSLDYYRVATDTDSHIMRKLGTASLGLNARKVLQLVLFAPDWTMATFRTMAKAMPGGSHDALVSQAHRRYMVKAALYYFALGNAINYATSNHSIFGNKNPLRIDLGDGRTMQFAKHETEPLAWLQDPFETLTNKFAAIPAAIWRTGKTVTTDVLRKKDKPTPHEIVAEMAMGAMPISLQQFVQNGVHASAIAGLLGLPVYGKTDEEKKEDKVKSREEAQRKRVAKNHEKLYGQESSP